ncbi:hypothetical protein B5P46_02510 [Rhizobium leguminosarum]|uniref:Uncharacterized protein n=1 Tax=Rhizobium leguminosarum TaxID=384 RepID=A0A4Q1UGC3_RHILE|nr:hypothetical protein B5P46_02510 [Rhizobium leguminosarum]
MPTPIPTKGVPPCLHLTGAELAEISNKAIDLAPMTNDGANSQPSAAHADAAVGFQPSAASFEASASGLQTSRRRMRRAAGASKHRAARLPIWPDRSIAVGRQPNAERRAASIAASSRRRKTGEDDAAAARHRPCRGSLSVSEAAALAAPQPLRIGGALLLFRREQSLGIAELPADRAELLEPNTPRLFGKTHESAPLRY